MSAYNIPTNVRKSVKAGGTIGQYEPLKLSTEDTANDGLVVVVATAITDTVIGWSLNDATSGDGLDMAIPNSGAIVPARVGSGGVTQGNNVGLDGTDKTEVAALTLAAGGGTIRQCLGQVLRTGVSNDLVPLIFAPFVYETA
jgi:hypothetical protein